MSEYLKRRQELKLGIRQPEPKKEQKPLPKRSEKMKQEMKSYKPLVKEYLARPENQNCKANLKGCTGKATVVHHKRGRGINLKVEKHWLPTCSFCNIEIERLDSVAREKGLKESVHKIENQ